MDVLHSKASGKAYPYFCTTKFVWIRASFYSIQREIVSRKTVARAARARPKVRRLRDVIWMAFKHHFVSHS